MSSQKISFSIWLLLIIANATILFLNANKIKKFNTSIFSILPQEKNSFIEKTNKALISPNQITIMLGHQNIDTLNQCIIELKSNLSSSNLFEEKSFLDTPPEKLFESFIKYNSTLIPQKILEQLAQTEGINKTLNQTIASLSLTLPPFVRNQITQDPLLNIFYFFQHIQPKNLNITFYKGHVFFKNGNHHYHIFTIECKDSSFDPKTQDTILHRLKIIENNLKDKTDTIEFINTGMIFYNHHFRSTAQKEISIIGIASIIAVVLIFIIIFKSIKQLLLTSFAIGAGILTGLGALTCIFDEIHIFTLVFGTSIIGVSIDYCFHFFADYFQEQNAQKQEKKTFKLSYAIILGAITTALSYFAIYFSNIELLQQMAIFASFGIFGTVMTIWLLLPVFEYKVLSLNNVPAIGTIKKINNLNAPLLKTSILLAGFLYPSSLFFTEISDNLKDMQPLPSHLIKNDLKIANVTNIKTPNSYFVIEGENAEETLIKEEALKEKLNQNLKQISLLGITDILPSKKKQMENHNKLSKCIQEQFNSYQSNQLAKQINLKEIYTKNINFMSFEDIESIQTFKKYHHMLQKNQDKWFSILFINDSSLQDNLISYQNHATGIHYINQPKHISESLKTIRITSTTLIAIATIGVAIFMMLLFGLRHGLLITFIPISSILFSITFVTIAHDVLSIGHFMGFIVLFGISIDYAIFLAVKKNLHHPTIIAIFLSGITTCISFGSLSLSSTAMLSHFGLVLLVGVSYSLITTPIIMSGKKNHG